MSIVFASREDVTDHCERQSSGTVVAETQITLDCRLNGNRTNRKGIYSLLFKETGFLSIKLQYCMCVYIGKSYKLRFQGQGKVSECCDDGKKPVVRRLGPVLGFLKAKKSVRMW